MYKNAAAEVIMKLVDRVCENARSDARDEAVRLSILVRDLEKEFPEAKKEIDTLYRRAK